MIAKVLCAAQNLPGGHLKGDFVSSLAEGQEFGVLLPDFIGLTISDMTAAQATQYMTPLGKKYTSQKQSESAQGFRVKFQIDPELAGDKNSDVRQELRDTIEAIEYASVTFFSQAADNMVFDVLKPIDLNQLMADVNDVLAEVLYGDPATGVGMYFLQAATVDNIIGAGGESTNTWANFNNAMKNKLIDPVGS